MFFRPRSSRYHEKIIKTKIDVVESNYDKLELFLRNLDKVSKSYFLVEAARGNSYELVKLTYKEGAINNSLNRYAMNKYLSSGNGSEALYYATFNKNYRMMKLIISKKGLNSDAFAPAIYTVLNVQDYEGLKILEPYIGENITRCAYIINILYLLPIDMFKIVMSKINRKTFFLAVNEEHFLKDMIMNSGLEKIKFYLNYSIQLSMKNFSLNEKLFSKIIKDRDVFDYFFVDKETRRVDLAVKYKELLNVNLSDLDYTQYVDNDLNMTTDFFHKLKIDRVKTFYSTLTDFAINMGLMKKDEKVFKYGNFFKSLMKFSKQAGIHPKDYLNSTRKKRIQALKSIVNNKLIDKYIYQKIESYM